MGRPVGSPEDRSLSIVIPAFNEANRIGASLRCIAGYFAERSDLLESIVVDDGSQDVTSAVVHAISKDHPLVRLLRYPSNDGKGFAVRHGVLSARGGRIAFCDADLSAPIEELDQLLAYLDKGYDIAIGSRGLRVPEKRVHRRLFRRVMAAVFNRLVRALLVHNIRDTQCGLKAFKRSVVLSLFAQQDIPGFAFDVELLWRAQRLSYQIAEVPISWVADGESRVRSGRDSLIMARDVVVLWFRKRVAPVFRAVGARVVSRKP